MNKFTYMGYMSDEALNFFGDNLIREERDGCAVMGYFVKLENDKTIMPSKGDMFEKNENNKLKLV